MTNPSPRDSGPSSTQISLSSSFLPTFYDSLPTGRALGARKEGGHLVCRLVALVAAVLVTLFDAVSSLAFDPPIAYVDDWGGLANAIANGRNALGTPGLMIEMVDGNSGVVEVNGQRLRFRGIGFDAPEWGECGWAEARRTARSLFPTGAPVLVFGELAIGDYDRYGRALLHVARADQENTTLAYEMLRQGWARAYSYRGQGHFYKSEFEAIEQDAKEGRGGEGGRGMWEATACPGPTPIPRLLPQPGRLY